MRAPAIDETPEPGELPRSYCARMAREKAEAVAITPNEVLLCADTVVCAGRRILGKPSDEAEARAFLSLLSGRRHRVVTAIALRTAERIRVREVVTTVKMKPLSSQEMDAYLRSGDWRDKAGGYGIQGAAAAMIPWIRGSYSAVVGLPLVETATLLRAAGIGLPMSR